MNNVWFVALVLVVVVRNAAGHKEDKTVHKKGVTALANTDHQPHSISRVKRSGCGGVHQSSSGHLHNLAYRNGYPANCTWKIVALPTEIIELDFFTLDLESCCAHVVIYTEKEGALSKKHGPFRGTEGPRYITSYANLLINFYTDGSGKRSRLYAHYRKHICGKTMHSTYGTIASPEFPEDYPPNKRCWYEIVAPPQHCINLNFTHFQLEDQSECRHDSVQINTTSHDGAVHQYRRACGNRAPNNITCDGTYLRLEFTSDGARSYSGFSAVFQTVYAECSNNNAGCKHICKSNAAGKHSCACHAGYVLHPDGHDCKEAPVNLSAEIVDSTSTLLTWKCISPAQKYEITIRRQNISQGENPEDAFLTTSDKSSPEREDFAMDLQKANAAFFDNIVSSMVIWTRSSHIWNATILLEGSRLKSSSYSLPVVGLAPYRDYEAHIRSCLANSCSREVSTAFSTSPSLFETPFISAISSDTTSIYLEWRFPHAEQWLGLDLQFEIRAHDNGFFRLITTAETELTITNLTSGADYKIEVRPFLEGAQERRKYGYPARAAVRTWPLVPLAPTLSARRFKAALNVLALSWKFSNSTVVRVEVATNSSDFTNCESLPTCDVVKLHNSNSTFKAGFLKISGLNPYEAYTVDLRGCNDHGCGNSTRVHVPPGVSEPSEPLSLQLSAINNATAYLCWQQPQKTGGSLTRYLVSWKCENGFTTAATTTEWCITATTVTVFIITIHNNNQNNNKIKNTIIRSTSGRRPNADLPIESQKCTFSVSAYNVADDGEELYGNPTTFSTQWPQTYAATEDSSPHDSSR